MLMKSALGPTLKQTGLVGCLFMSCLAHVFTSNRTQKEWNTSDVFFGEAKRMGIYPAVTMIMDKKAQPARMLGP
jgi:hypothetical protein